MKKNLISQEEMNIWHMWKGSYKTIFGRVIKDLTDKTGLSEGDFGILDRLDQFGNGELRQQELADSMDWDKSRLSHHLTRMEKRGLVRRKPADTDRGVQVILTADGKTALDEARPVVSAAIKEHFLSLLTEEDVASIGRIGEKVKED
ncbi:MarR family winged helix-turn-helix transcriptional regulator [Metabacillus sp. 113a]|uniref:MarR family winged helix-turn-helix transcriptional regulator n=1 Tax=Metabacillus sp. 113a TaxID=3404706 RepID=UPI003CF9F405